VKLGDALCNAALARPATTAPAAAAAEMAG